jgi:preprotein translocase subunit SecD
MRDLRANSSLAQRFNCTRLLYDERKTRLESKTASHLITAALTITPFAADTAKLAEFEIRRVVEENDSPDTETLPFAKPQAGSETSLRVLKQSGLDKSHIAEATVESDAFDHYSNVNVKLTKQGKERLAALTKGSVGKRLAIISEGKILMAPVIREELSMGSFAISGQFSKQEAAGLATKLKPVKK